MEKFWEIIWPAFSVEILPLIIFIVCFYLGQKSRKYWP